MDGFALWLASEAIANSEELSGVSYGLISRQSNPTDEAAFITNLNQKLASITGDDFRAVWIAASWGTDTPQSATLRLIGSESEANALAPFLDDVLNDVAGLQRFEDTFEENRTRVLKNWQTADDEALLRSALRDAIVAREGSKGSSTTAAHEALLSATSARPAMPPGAITIDQMLAEARSTLTRLSPLEAHAPLSSSPSTPLSILIDIRPAAQRALEGSIPDALIIERNVLEWRVDPQSPARLLEPAGITDSYETQFITFCSEGYTSSLAAASLQKLGLKRATDIVGGFKAWKAAGLPVSLSPTST